MNRPTSALIVPPQRVQHRPVGEDADQPVLHSDVMEERLLGVDDERVRDPEQLHQPAVQAQALVSLEHQALVCPALPQEYCGGVVLQVWLCAMKRGDKRLLVVILRHCMCH